MEKIIFPNLQRIEALPELPRSLSGSKTLGGMLARTLSELATHYEVYSKHGTPPAKKTITAIIGPPGAGKSFAEREFHDLSYDCLRRYGVLQQRISWEEDGEAPARRDGLINPDPTQSNTLEEMEIASSYLQTSVDKSLQGRSVISIEFPATTGMFFAGKQVGRDLGYSLLEKLIKKQPPFNKYDYQLNLAALFPGINLRHIMVELRKPSKDITDPESARRFALDYGLDPDIVSEEYQYLAQGATDEQVQKIEAEEKLLVRNMTGRLILPGLNYEQFKEKYGNWLQTIGVERPFTSHLNLQMGYAFAYIVDNLRKSFPYSLHHIFFGWNNPTIEELKIITDLDKLVARLNENNPRRGLPRILA